MMTACADLRDCKQRYRERLYCRLRECGWVSTGGRVPGELKHQVVVVRHSPIVGSRLSAIGAIDWPVHAQWCRCYSRSGLNLTRIQDFLAVEQNVKQQDAGRCWAFGKTVHENKVLGSGIERSNWRGESTGSGRRDHHSPVVSKLLRRKSGHQIE